MTDTVASKPPIVDRDFGEKFFWAVDRPMEYSVYHLLPNWWAVAPQPAIDAYSAQLAAMDGAEGFLAERFIADTLTLESLEGCPEGSLGAGYRSFIVDHGLDANLLVNYKHAHEAMTADGTLDRMPADLAYVSVRLSQIHDFAHTIAGFTPDPAGEIKMAAFHLAQLRFPYHSMRLAVTSAHAAFVNPGFMEPFFDAMSIGWIMGRKAQNLHFTRWEDQVDTPLEEIRERLGIDRSIDTDLGAA